MRLAEAVAGLGDAVIVGDPDTEVVDLTLDSRSVRPGWMFCAVPGGSADGADFAAAAVAAGAVAVLAERRLDLAVPCVVVPDGRLATALVASALHGHPSRTLDVIGITGTNGKTTTCHLLAAVLAEAGRTVEVLGTLSGARTTPEAPELQRTLAGWRDAGVDTVAMEVSSHALALRRVDGTRFRVAGFTNLTRDHLDFHHTMEAYFEAKARLFTPELADRAVVDVDGPYGRLLADTATLPTDRMSLDDATDLVLGATGSSFRWRGREVHLTLGGSFNVANALVAAGVASALGVADETVAAGLSRTVAVPGRFEPIDVGQPFAVVVDFAHTPDGLDRVLAAASDLVGAADGVAGRAASDGRPGRVLVVFGCGGERDPDKRAPMGEVAARGADVVVVTADNSRSEDTAAIIGAVIEGTGRAEPRRAADIVVEPDRRIAIARTLAMAQPGDIVVVAGKGHERTQDIGGVVVPFDDRDVVRDELERLRAAP